MIRAKLCRGSLPLPALLVALWAALFMGDDAKSQPAPTPVAQVKVDPAITQMAHISVQTAGKGPAVILVPGLSSPRESWDGTWERLATDHKVYLVQVNGFGGSEPLANLKPGLLDGIVADLNTLIARDKLTKPALMGHSMGGLVGMMLAARHPDSLGRLMIVDSLPYFGVLMAPGMNVTVADVQPRAAMMRDAVAAGYGKPANPAAIEQNLQGMTLKPENLVRMRKWAAAADPRVTAQALYEDLTTDMRGELGKITVPVTVAYAWNETYPRKEQAAQFYAAQYAGLTGVKLAGIGPAAHFVMLDQPALFDKALDAFLAD